MPDDPRRSWVVQHKANHRRIYAPSFDRFSLDRAVRAIRQESALG